MLRRLVHIKPLLSKPVFTAVRFYSGGPGPLTVPAIESRVLQLLKDFEKVEATKLSLDAHFINDLGLDSLDQVEITMALEDEFNIEIPDKDAEEIFTARQAVEKVWFLSLDSCQPQCSLRVGKMSE
ncbi:acyl carrier protein-like protein [Gorgonomyces haynaldii]|nr:acyl carrier protein-like protein [Gorgonomyces haynaldii]